MEKFERIITLYCIDRVFSKISNFFINYRIIYSIEYDCT